MNKVEDGLLIATKALKAIATKFGIEKQEKFEQLVLGEGEDQATLEADAFEAGQAIFVLSPEGERVALPVGEYPTEIGLIVVVEEGLIAEVRVEEEVAEEVEDAPMEQAEAQVAPVAKKVVESVSKETHFSTEQTKMINDAFDSMKKEIFSKLEGMLSVGDKVELEDGTHQLENKEESIEVKDNVVEAIVEEVKPAKHSMSKQSKQKSNFSSLEGKSTKSRLTNFLNNRK